MQITPPANQSQLKSQPLRGVLSSKNRKWLLIIVAILFVLFSLVMVDEVRVFSLQHHLKFISDEAAMAGAGEHYGVRVGKSIEVFIDAQQAQTASKISVMENTAHMDKNSLSWRGKVVNNGKSYNVQVTEKIPLLFLKYLGENERTVTVESEANNVLEEG